MEKKKLSEYEVKRDNKKPLSFKGSFLGLVKNKEFGIDVEYSAFLTESGYYVIASERNSIHTEDYGTSYFAIYSKNRNELIDTLGQENVMKELYAILDWDNTFPI